MGHIKRGSAEFNKTLLALFLGSFVTFADLYSTQPVIPLIAKSYDITPTWASLSLSFSTGTMAIMLVIISIVTNGIDRKKVMSVALFLSAVLTMLVGFVDSIEALLCLRAVQGIVLAGFPSIAMAYITEEFHTGSLGYVMGIYVSGSSIGGLAGRLIVGSLSEFISWAVAISLLGMLSFFLALLFRKMLPNSTVQYSEKTHTFAQTLKSMKKNIQNPNLVLLYLMGFLLMGSFVSIYNYIGIHLMEEPYNLSQVFISFIFVVYLVGTFSSTWMGRLADRLQRQRVLLAGVIIMLVGVVLTMSVSLIMQIIGLVLLTFGFFGAHSIASGWVGLLAERTEKAQTSSLYLLFYYVGSSVVGALGGVFLHTYGWFGEVVMVLILLLIGIGCTLFIKEKKQVQMKEKLISRIK